MTKLTRAELLARLRANPRFRESEKRAAVVIVAPMKQAPRAPGKATGAPAPRRHKR
jgi:hypothetical protein